MLGISRGKNRRSIPETQSLAEKQDPIARKLEEVLARVEEINRLLTDALSAEYESHKALALKVPVPAADVISPSILGRMLVEEGIITESQLAKAEAEQRKYVFLGQVLVEMGIVKQDVLAQFLGKQCKIPHLSLLDYEISEDILKLISKEICLRHNLLPIDKLGRILTLAMVDPLDTEALKIVRKLHPDLRVKSVLCNWRHFKTVTDKLFGLADDERTK